MIPIIRKRIPGTRRPMIKIKSKSAGVALIPNIPKIRNIIPTNKEKIPRAFLFIVIKITLHTSLI